MKVILLQNVARLGNKDDVVEVSEGYARNFLIKNSLAKELSPGALKDLSAKKEAKRAKKEKELQKEIDFLLKYKEQPLLLKLKANEKGHLFEKLDAKKISKLLSDLSSANFSEKSIVLDAPIKELGSYELSVKIDNKTFKILLELKSE